MLSRLRAVRAHGDDAGFTLAEVIVGSTLAGIAGAIGMTMFVVVSQQATETTTRENLGADSRVALAQIASDIRLADSPTAIPVTPDGRFQVFTADKITFYSNRDTGRTNVLSRTPPSRVTVARVADTTNIGKSKLVMSVWNPITKYGISGKPYPDPYAYADNYPADPSQTITLAQGIGNDTSKADEAIFSYCSSAPDPAPTATAASPNSTAAPVPACNQIIASTASTQTTRDVENRARAGQISSVIIRLRIGGEGFTSGQDTYQPSTWLTTRVAVSGKVSPPTVSAP